MWHSWNSAAGPMREILDRVPDIARGREPVLIVGETGSGREALARLIHHCGPRSAARFSAANIAVLTYLRRRLFTERFRVDYEAETGPTHGYFEGASGGTLLVEYIHSLPPEDQAPLLHLIVTGRVRVDGSPDEKRVDVRLITTTNARPLSGLSPEVFNRELAAGLGATTIHMPPLRERLDEVPGLALFFLRRWRLIPDDDGTAVHRDICNLRVDRVGMTDLVDMVHRFMTNMREPDWHFGQYVLRRA